MLLIVPVVLYRLNIAQNYTPISIMQEKSYFGLSTLVLPGPHDMHITISNSCPFINVTCLINAVNENYGLLIYVDIA